MFTTKQIKFIKKKEFAKLLLNENIKAFVIYVISLSLSFMSIYLAKEAQIVLPLIIKVINPDKHSDFSNFFLKKKSLVLSKIIKLN